MPCEWRLCYELVAFRPKMTPAVALGRILVARRFACTPIGGHLVMQNVVKAFCLLPQGPPAVVRRRHSLAGFLFIIAKEAVCVRVCV